MHYIFVYGTLLFPEIVFGLCGREFTTQKAILKGFKRYLVNGHDYPAVISDDVSDVEGKLLFDVDEESMKILTFFEGDNYAIKEVFVHAGIKSVKALVFAWNGLLCNLGESDWDIDRFEQKSLRYYAEKVIPETVREFKQLRKQ
jgi:gamma-glutamylcyclotransferase (GGCT)/AIG2-like uncharacterized protein YtfP